MYGNRIWTSYIRMKFSLISWYTLKIPEHKIFRNISNTFFYFRTSKRKLKKNDVNQKKQQQLRITLTISLTKIERYYTVMDVQWLEESHIVIFYLRSLTGVDDVCRQQDGMKRTTNKVSGSVYK